MKNEKTQERTFAIYCGGVREDIRIRYGLDEENANEILMELRMAESLNGGRDTYYISTE
jgi:hypothetical protein